jgi:hypothetical protein
VYRKPSKQLDRNLLLGTWNLRSFGDLTEKWRSEEEDSPKRDLFDVRCIAEIVSRFDVVAIQEARGDLSALRAMLLALGDSCADGVRPDDPGRAERDSAHDLRRAAESPFLRPDRLVRERHALDAHPRPLERRQFDFVQLLGGGLTKTALSWRVSDHYPLWVELSLREAD